MMLRMARTGLTTPAVVGRGLSEGLGLSAATMEILVHGELGDAAREACGSQNLPVAASLVEDRGLKREGVEVHEQAISVLSFLFERVHQLAADAVAS